MYTKEELLRAKIPYQETGIEVKKGMCAICSPGNHCGLDVYVRNGRILKVEGTKEHPFNQGYICTKGAMNKEYIYRKDRIRTPLRRVGKRGEGKFEPITWEQAYKEIADRLNQTRADYGADSVGPITTGLFTHLAPAIFLQMTAAATVPVSLPGHVPAPVIPGRTTKMPAPSWGGPGAEPTPTIWATGESRP